MRKNFTLDVVNKTLTINSAFAKAIEMGEGDDYKTYLRLKKDIPGLTIVKRTHKTPSKYHTKSGETFNCNQFKNLTYNNMENFINALPENEELIKAYLFLKYAGALPQTSRYTAVRRWFVAQFPEFRKNPLFYLYNPVKVVDITPFLNQQEEEKETA